MLMLLMLLVPNTPVADDPMLGDPLPPAVGPPCERLVEWLAEWPVAELWLILTVVPVATTGEIPVLCGDDDKNMVRGGLLAAIDVPVPEALPPPK